MSWNVLTDESKKIKREKKRKRKISRGSKRGRYIVLGSRARAGRKSAVHCVTCGNTLPVNIAGDVCRSCENKAILGVVEKQTQASSKLMEDVKELARRQMEIPEMSEKK